MAQEDRIEQNGMERGDQMLEGCMSSTKKWNGIGRSI